MITPSKHDDSYIRPYRVLNVLDKKCYYFAITSKKMFLQNCGDAYLILLRPDDAQLSWIPLKRISPTKLDIDELAQIDTYSYFSLGIALRRHLCRFNKKTQKLIKT